MFKRSEVTYLKYVAENCNNNKKEIINIKIEKMLRNLGLNWK